MFQTIDVAACAAGQAADRDRTLWRLIPLVIVQRFTYRQILYWVMLRALLAAMKGTFVGWGKLLVLSLVFALSFSLTTQTPAKEDKEGTMDISEVDRIAKRAMVMIDKGQFKESYDLLSQYIVTPYSKESLPLLYSLALLKAREGDFVTAAATYHDILQFAPTDPAAIRGRVFATLRMGAPQLAVAYAEVNPDEFTEEEMRSLRQASAGRSISWGGAEGKAGIGPKRFLGTDRALEENAEVRESHLRAGTIDSASGRYTEFDRMVALRDRVRMDEVIALYTAVKERGVAIPPYALAAAADAYLYKRQPRQARDLYLQALTLSKDDPEHPNREWQLKLFDAYIDADEFDAARELIDNLVKEIPPVLYRGLPGVEVNNELYEQARVDAARARLYSENFDDAQEMLEGIIKDAPFSLDARLAYADVLQFREQPRAAQDQYASVLVDDPANVFGASGIAETALALHDLESAEVQLGPLTANYPENREVQRVQRLLDAYRQPMLTVVSGAGWSPSGGGNQGNQDWLVDATLYSAPLHQHWRAFIHSFNAEATFEDEAGAGDDASGTDHIATRRRIGMGAEYRAPTWQVSGELSQDQTELDDFGGTLRMAWLPRDQWTFSAGIESDSDDVPLEASAAGITMHALRFDAAYNKDESRSIGGMFGYAWLSDSNRHFEANADWQERWSSGPIYKLDTRFSLLSSSNTFGDAIYFNPRRDFSADAQMINEWTLWRSYRRSFKNRLVFGGGLYWQQDFGTIPTATVVYEHEWILEGFRTLSYGIAYQRHPYDGKMDERVAAFLNLTWHF